MTALKDIDFVDLQFSLQGDGAELNLMNRQKVVQLPPEFHDEVIRIKTTVATNADRHEFDIIHDGVPYRCSRVDDIDEPWFILRRGMAEVLELDHLGLDAKLTAILHGLGRARGLVAVLGPLGHGKTTTASALFRAWMKAQGGKGAVIENSRERRLNGEYPRGRAWQLEVLKDEDWEKHVRHALRWGISLLFVGEIRTPMAAALALRAAMAGLLVIITAHGDSIPSGLKRIVDMAAQVDGIAAAFENLASGLTAALHQTLVQPPPLVESLFVKPKSDDPIRMTIRTQKLEMLGNYIQQQHRAAATDRDAR